MTGDIWYLIVRTLDTPDVTIDVWPVGDDPDLFDGYVMAARTILGVPADWDGFGGWDFQLSPGTPAASLLAQATVHDTPPGT